MIIGSGWKKKDKNDQTYLSVVIDLPLLGTLRILLYPNSNKKSANAPDYEVRWLPDRPQREQVKQEEVPF